MGSRTLREIFIDRLAAKGLKPTAVSRAAGKDGDTLPQFLRGVSQSPTFANADAFAQAMGYTGGVVEMILDAATVDTGVLTDAVVAVHALMAERHPPWVDDKRAVAEVIVDFYRMQLDAGRDPLQDDLRLAEAICRGKGLAVPPRPAAGRGQPAKTAPA